MSVISTYLGPVHTAFLIFPLLALALTFPYIIIEYRRYGAIPLLRTIIVYTFILYLINAYFQVILPLPSRAEVASSSAPNMQLTAGHFLQMIRRTTDFSIHDRSTWWETLANSYVYQAILNFLLLLPLGIYLHYYFRRGIFSTLLIVFLTSLFFEVTQLTGLYGIYAHAYRTFDVDDLILNTAGGIFGWILEPLVCLPLPSRDRIDEAAYYRGKKVPFFRRFLAFLVDYAVVGLTQTLLIYLIPSNRIVLTLAVVIGIVLSFLWFALFPVTTGGYTPGGAVFRIRIVSGRRGNARVQLASPAQYAIRSALLVLLIADIPDVLYLTKEMMQVSYNQAFGFWHGLRTFSQICAAIFLIEIFVRAITGDRRFLYERVSGTRVISTIRLPDPDRPEEDVADGSAPTLSAREMKRQEKEDRRRRKEEKRAQKERYREQWDQLGRGDSAKDYQNGLYDGDFDDSGAPYKDDSYGSDDPYEDGSYSRGGQYENESYERGDPYEDDFYSPDSLYEDGSYNHGGQYEDGAYGSVGPYEDEFDNRDDQNGNNSYSPDDPYENHSDDHGDSVEDGSSQEDGGRSDLPDENDPAAEESATDEVSGDTRRIGDTVRLDRPSSILHSGDSASLSPNEDDAIFSPESLREIGWLADEADQENRKDAQDERTTSTIPSVHSDR